MIDALVTGKLFSEPQRMTSRNGNTFTKVTLTVATGEGVNMFANLVCFDDQAQLELLALDKGDSVAVAATLTPKAYTDRNGGPAVSIDGVIHHLTTAYHITRKRKATHKPEDKTTAHSGGVMDLEDGPV